MKIPPNIQDVYKRATCVYTKAQIEAALNKVAADIQQKLETKNPILLCVMKGGIVLTGNLLPRLDFPLEVDYAHATRYQGSTQGGELQWKAKPTCVLKDRTILIIDDVLDHGVTLAAVVEYCKNEQAKEVYTAVLVDKVRGRKPGGLSKADFSALVIDDRFVFGYGLDYQEYLRNAPGIYEVAEEHQ